MTERRRPTGVEWAAFLAAWRNADHKGKLELATFHGVSYDTAKHWVSENPEEEEPVAVAPASNDSGSANQGILALAANLGDNKQSLDFVTFDIETSNLNADFSVTLCAGVKPFGKPTQIFRADDYPEWKTDRANDQRLIRDIADELRRHAIVITHYGQKFDIPFLRAKMLKYGLPVLPPMFGIDTWRIAKTNFKVSSRRLGALSRYLSLQGKSEVEGALWMDAAYNGDKEALDKIVEHNRVDCEVLEVLAQMTFPYLKSIPRL